MFRDERPIKLSGTALEQGLERGSDGSLVSSAEAIELI